MNKVKDLVYAPKMYRYENQKFEKKFEYLSRVLLLSEKKRPVEDVNKFIEYFLTLDIMERNLCSYANPTTLLAKVLVNAQIVDIAANEIIYDYETPSDCGYVIIRGKAKDFLRKNVEQIENETKFRLENNKGTEEDVEMPMSTHPNETEEDLSSPGKSLKHSKSGVMRKFQKVKNIMPLIPSMFADMNKNANQIFEDKKYKKLTIKRAKTKLKGHPELFRDIDPGIDEALFEKFLKHKNTYFVGPIMKVKYSETLMSGDAIGLEALANDFCLRARCLVAETDCRLLKIDGRDFRKCLDIELKYLALKSSIFHTIFSHFENPTIVNKFMHLWSEEKCRPGDHIYKEGDESHNLYLIGEGTFALYKNAKDHIDSLKSHNTMMSQPNEDKHDKLQVSDVTAGNFFGEEIFLGCSRDLSAVSRSINSEYYMISKEKLKEVYNKYFELIDYIKRVCSMKLNYQLDRIVHLAKQKNVDMSPTINLYQNMLSEENKLRKFGDRCAPPFSITKGITFHFESYKTKFDKRDAYDRFVIVKPGQKRPDMEELLEKFDEYAGIKEISSFRPGKTSPRNSNLLSVLKSERLNSQASRKEDMQNSYRKSTMRSESCGDIKAELLENFKRVHIPTTDFVISHEDNFKTTEVKHDEERRTDEDTDQSVEKSHRRNHSLKDPLPTEFYKEFAEMNQFNSMLPKLSAFPSRTISLQTTLRQKDFGTNTATSLNTAKMLLSNRFSLSTTHVDFEEMVNSNSTRKPFDSLDYVKKVKQQAFERRSKSLTKSRLKDELSRELMITKKEIAPFYQINN